MYEWKDCWPWLMIPCIWVCNIEDGFTDCKSRKYINQKKVESWSIVVDNTVEYKLEAQVSLYRSLDINRLTYKCLHDEMSTTDSHLGCRLVTLDSSWWKASWPPKDHPYCLCLLWILPNIFNTLKTFSICPLVAATLNFGSAQKHNFCRSPLIDHSLFALDWFTNLKKTFFHRSQC